MWNYARYVEGEAGNEVQQGQRAPRRRAAVVARASTLAWATMLIAILLPGSANAAGETIITKKPPRYTPSGNAVFEFSSELGSEFECQLDDEPAVPCTSPHSYSSVPEGDHIFKVRLLGTDSDPAEWRWTVDWTPPKMTDMEAWPRPFVPARYFTVAWAGWDALSGIASFDIGYHRWRYSGERRWRWEWRQTKTTGASFIAKPGFTYCFRGKVRDRAGNISSWSGRGCTALPVDNTQLSHRGKWTKRQAYDHYLNTYSQSSRRGDRLILRGVKARRVALVAATCRRCGSVAVRWNGSLLKRIRLYSPQFRTKRFFSIAKFDRRRRGRITITVVSRGKRVIVDGLGVRFR